MGRTVTIEGLSDAVEEVLKEYDDTVKCMMPQTVRAVANRCKNEIRANARGHGWGDYAGTWSAKVTDKGEESYTVTVYGKGKGARLAHLLEHGHPIVSKDGRVCGRARAFSHIKQPEINAVKNIEREIRKIL